MVDITPAAEGESAILLAVDPTYPQDLDFLRRPENVTLRTIDRPTSEQMTTAIASLSPSRRAYEERRAAARGIDLHTYLAAKAEPSDLASAVDALIESCARRDRLVLRTTSGVYSADPKAFATMQSTIMDLQGRIERLLAERTVEDRTDFDFGRR
jgi:hypothetical protein